MTKYTKEFRVKLVKEYLSGEVGGSVSIAKKHCIPKATLEQWINKYNSGGFKNLSKKLKNNKFTSEFKLSVIQYRLSLIHISEPTRLHKVSRMPSSA